MFNDRLFRSHAWFAPLLAAVVAGAPVSADTTTPGDPPYRYSVATRDGIGKIYMGREIAHVMGHRGAAWLERPTREREEGTDLLVNALPVEPDAVIADIGAGTGYFTFRIARRVPEGRVLAVDIQPEMLARIEARIAGEGVRNVTTVRGAIDDSRLPAGGVDLVLLVDAYHEFSRPLEMGRSLYRALKPGGRLVLVEYRAEDPRVPIKPLHKMSEAQARREMEALGLRWLETRDMLPQQHFMVFMRP